MPAFVDPVGLFVEWPTAALSEYAALGVRTLQLHGNVRFDEPNWDGATIPAFPVKDAESLGAIDDWLSFYAQGLGWRPAAILVDAHVPGMHGGTGQTAPWHLLADYRPPVPLILAGGLTPENVAEAVRLVRPYAVDVASGVESRPGVKDPEKVRRFIDAARSA